MSRAISAGVTTGILLAGIAAIIPPAPAIAQNPERVARRACWSAIVREARGVMAARNVIEDGDARVSQAGNAETAVSGRGLADRRSFTYRCTYNIRSGDTYSLSVRPTGGGGRPPGGGGGRPPFGDGNDSGFGRLPGGSWSQSCRAPRMSGSVLSAQCNDGRKWRDTSINVRQCPSGQLGNQFGRLICQ